MAGGSAHEPKEPQQEKQSADGYRRAYDLVGQFPFLHQQASVRLPVQRNIDAIRAGDARNAPPERGGLWPSVIADYHRGPFDLTPTGYVVSPSNNINENIMPMVITPQTTSNSNVCFCIRKSP